MIKYSICILTYKRSELLENLLLSLEAQENIDKNEFEIIIVDNDESQSGKFVVEKHKIKFNSTYKIRYYSQPIKNLSKSRNLALEKSIGLYILFIDDDEYADKLWAYYLINGIIKYKADVAFGRLELSFSSEIPKLLRCRDYFYPKVLETGSDAKVFYSGNVIIKKSVLDELKIYFDEDFGITGGEDTHLFQRIKDSGKKLIFINEAIIYEFVPQSRGNIKYLVKRNFRSGNGYILRNINLYNNNFTYLFLLFVKSLIKILIYTVLLSLSFLSKKLLIKYILKTSAAFGELFAFFHIKIKMYK